MPHTVWPRSAAPRVPVLAASHCWLQGLFRRHLKTQRQVCLSLCGVSGPWCAQGFVWALWVSLRGMGFDSKCDFTPPTILLGLIICPWTWGNFLCGSQHLPLNGCLAVSCNFGVLAGEHECKSFYSISCVKKKPKAKPPCTYQDPEERSMTPQETDPMSVQESPAEAWVGSGLLQGRGHWVQQCLHGTLWRRSPLSPLPPP